MNNTLPKYEKYKDSGVEWLGEIPEHWDRKRIKFELKYQKGKNPKEITLEETLDIYLSMEFLRSNSKKIQYVKNKKDLIEVNSGDILLLWDGSNAGEFIKGKKGILSSTMAMIKLNSINKQFAWHYLNIVERQLRETTVGMGIPHVSGEELNNLMMLIPPITEQTLIAQFLDRKTALIDQAIGIKEKQIELLKEHRQILIHKAVTRGLNPDVKMKDSGVEWIGEVPEGWEVKKAKFLFTEINDRSTSGNEELLSVSHMTGVTPRSEKSVSMFMSEDYTGSKLCRKDDLIYNIMWAWMGALGVSDRIGLVSPSYAVYRQKDSKNFNMWFLEQLLKDTNYIVHYNQISTGLHSSRLRFYSDMFFNMSIGVPPRSEQDEIVEFAKGITSKISSAISLKLQEIEKLKEYKATLINSAVTGKIKVNP